MVAAPGIKIDDVISMINTVLTAVKKEMAEKSLPFKVKVLSFSITASRVIDQGAGGQCEAFFGIPFGASIDHETSTSMRIDFSMTPTPSKRAIMPEFESDLQSAIQDIKDLYNAFISMKTFDQVDDVSVTLGFDVKKTGNVSLFFFNTDVSQSQNTVTIVFSKK